MPCFQLPSSGWMAGRSRFHKPSSAADAYVALLLEAVEATASEVSEDLHGTHGLDGRQREALQLAACKLEQLRSHLATSRRRLNDLRNLRLILHGEGSSEACYRPTRTKGAQ
jgi:hypothetical protein